jgi:L-lactate dehydrogenase complex protein LldE
VRVPQFGPPERRCEAVLRPLSRPFPAAAPVATTAKGGHLSDAVALFPTCLGDLITPETVEHAQNALEACGLEVRPVRRATCCGQPAYNAGYTSQARRVARATLRALAQTTGPIVVPAGSCAAMMSRHWVGLFAGDRDADLARQVAARVVEFSAVVAEHTDTLERHDLHWEGRVAYHDSCHMLRELGLRGEPRAVLAAVRGLDLVVLESADRCCGFGGTFSVRYPDVSVAMADTKLDDARAHAVDVIVSADPGCLMQLGGRAARTGGGPRVVHLATLLHEAGLR